MSSPYSPLWMRRGGYAHRDLRVSDAERAEVADRLARHYSDGRLDQAEFDERVDQAMRAKTRSDMNGLLDDLPSPEESQSSPASTTKVVPRRGDARPHHHHHVLVLALAVVLAFALAHAIIQLYIPWLLIGVLAVLWLVYGPGQHRKP